MHLVGIMCVVMMLAASGCGSSPKVATASLPANVMARPRGIVGVIPAPENSHLPEALRALGVPYRVLPIEGFTQHDLTHYSTIVVDEMALDNDAMTPVYGRIMREVRFGRNVVILHQRAERISALSGPARKIVAREVDFTLRLVTIRGADPMLKSPNAITREDLDSLGRHANQIVAGGADARAILSSNTNDADKAAVLLWDRYEDGTIWYLSVPIVARAAAGHPSEQRLLANLLSNK